MRGCSGSSTRARPRYAVEVRRHVSAVEGGRVSATALASLKQRVDAAAKAGRSQPARILSPVAPSKVVAIGLNYKDHAAEMNKPLPAEPLMFMKPSTAVIGPGDAIRIPPDVGEIHYEAELGVVIGKRASRVSADKAHGARARSDVPHRRHRARAAAEGRFSTRARRASTRSRRSVRASRSGSIRRRSTSKAG